MSVNPRRITKVSQLPASLRSRNGWVEYLELRRSAQPHLHQIEPTNHCPYTCIMCPRSDKMTRDLGFMDLDVYRRVIDEVATYDDSVRAKEIELFHFGESLLHPDFAEMVAHAASKDLLTTLSVNGPSLSQKRAEALIAANPFKIIISLDGHDEESYRNIRGPVANFEKARENIEAIIELHREANSETKLLVRMIEMRENEGQGEVFKREWEAKGIEVELRTFFPWTDPELADLGDFERYPPFMPCPFPWQYTVVQWDGSVVPCCRDYDGVNAVGNIHEQPLAEIWNGPRYTEFREQHRTGEYGDNTLCIECMSMYYNEGE